MKKKTSRATRIIRARYFWRKVINSVVLKDGGGAASSLLGKLMLRLGFELPPQPTKNPKIQSILYLQAISQDFLTTAQ
jgi:hypothetical protein